MHSSDMFPSAFAGVMLIVAIVAIVVSLAILAFVCWLLMGCFERIPPAYRKMEPAMVWLLMIPCFNLVWNFFVYLRLTESYQAYFTANGKTDGGDYGRGLALAYCISSACCIVPLVNWIAGPASLVLLIIVLVKMTGYKNLIPVASTASGAPPPPPAP